jgi:hypothetical protein
MLMKAGDLKRGDVQQKVQHISSAFIQVEPSHRTITIL